MTVRRSFIDRLSSLVAACVLLTPGERLFAEDRPAETVLLGVRGAAAHAHLALRIEVADRDLSQLRSDTFRTMFAYYDRDNSGQLSEAERERLPTLYGIRQGLWNPFHFSTARLKPPRLRKNSDGAEAPFGPGALAESYHRRGLEMVLVGYGRAPDAAALTDALLGRIDADRDGVAGEAEWHAADQALRACDTNEDELISPGELLPGALYPGATGSRWLPRPDRESDEDMAVLPVQLLSRISENPRSGEQTVHWTARLDARGESADPQAELQIRKPGLWLTLRIEADRFPKHIGRQRKRLAEHFDELDDDGNGVLVAAEVLKPGGVDFASLSALADRDEDASLSAAEFAAWLNLRETIARGHALVSILDLGPELYALLDDDRDGRLSPRELKGAWRQLRCAECIGDDGFERSRLPHQFECTISHGQPRLLPAQPMRSGPAWFLAMDRNGDGDVSRREFPGVAEAFRQLDCDGDGLLSALEARGRGAVEE